MSNFVRSYRIKFARLYQLIFGKGKSVATPSGHTALIDKDPMWLGKATGVSFPNMDKLHTKEMVESLAVAIAPESTYEFDNLAAVDDWSFDPANIVEAINTDKKVQFRNDCDGQRALLWVLKELGWKKEWLAECAVDVNQKDWSLLDHYIALVYIPAEQCWYALNCWAYGKVIKLEDTMSGNYEANNGQLATKYPYAAYGYSRLSDRVFGVPLWYQGLPK